MSVVTTLAWQGHRLTRYGGNPAASHTGHGVTEVVDADRRQLSAGECWLGVVPRLSYAAR